MKKSDEKIESIKNGIPPPQPPSLAGYRSLPSLHGSGQDRGKVTKVNSRELGASEPGMCGNII